MNQVNPWTRWLFLAAACLPTGLSAAPDNTSTVMTPAQVEEDFDLAVKAVEAALPDATWFQSERAWRLAKQEARQMLPYAEDAQGLFRVLRPLLSRIGEGHLFLQRSPAMKRMDRQGQGLLPLDIHWTEGGAWVEMGWGDAANVSPGTRLLAIDGESADDLVRESMAALGHDGRIATGAMREAGGAGYAKLRYWMRGGAKRYRLRLQDASGEINERVVAGIAAAARTAPTRPEESPLASLEWLDGQTARLLVPTFSNRLYREAGSDYRTVIRQLFETLNTRGARNLILDLRRNGGGSEGNENYLFSYFVRDPLRKYASVEARDASLSVADRQGRLYSVEVFDKQELAAQERLPNGHLSRRNEPPEGLMSHWQARSPLFDGRLIVLAGGETFSGAAELSSMLYHVQRGLFVGEEVAGAHAGNTSGYTWEVRLPNSGMLLHIPLLKFRFAWDDLPLGRGVPPHCPVSPDLPGTSQDSALEVAYALTLVPWTVEDPPVCPMHGSDRSPSLWRSDAGDMVHPQSTGR
ncbi:S41 family peptidase [Luteimonas saliphila]|uniref:S41 family peptidase n=1 Tax=Luteimonas saliphila TaxID=2804919 RepID=UPI00192DDE1D|nr:S41 family peptidase [Luteimonas saliphila]